MTSQSKSFGSRDREHIGVGLRGRPANERPDVPSRPTLPHTTTQHHHHLAETDTPLDSLNMRLFVPYTCTAWCASSGSNRRLRCAAHATVVAQPSLLGPAACLRA